MRKQNAEVEHIEYVQKIKRGVKLDQLNEQITILYRIC